MVLMNPGLDRSLQAVRADVALNAEQIHQDIRLAEQASILASHQFEDLVWGISNPTGFPRREILPTNLRRYQ